MWKRRTEGSPQGILVDILTMLRVLSKTQVLSILRRMLLTRVIPGSNNLSIPNFDRVLSPLVP